MSAKVLVLYSSKHGRTRDLAEKIALGVEKAACEAVIRTVPEVSANNQQSEPNVPSSGHAYASKQDLIACDALALGSPTHFGNMTASMKAFWDSTTDLWMKGALVDKPACVFTSSSSMHGGQESTLLSMMLPLFHHGMCILGLPYSEPELHETTSGCSPYGVSHVSGIQDSLSADEEALSISMGKRLALCANKLKA